MTGPDEQQIPEATIARLPGYLRVLNDFQAAGVTRVSSTDLAEAAGVQPALLRRDLSYFGSYGTRGVGYEVPLLVREIGLTTGGGTVWPVIMIGVGNLGRALATHGGLLQQDFKIVALVDVDPAVVGSTVGRRVVQHVDRLEELVAQYQPRIAIVATPAHAAQATCDRLVDAGITSILNFAPTGVVAPAHVTVRAVDLSQELRILAFHEARRVVASESATAQPVQPVQSAQSAQSAQEYVP
ncbi:redox-sensing transcriptional repressor Rex [Luteococcus sp. Sow4_B9]|uniref:redox-sensing transcriptional repressor Rex n=1 Tax=Luteococcus sp. Sow4_B9 TaxID=3438792 RepID=UPI003F9D757E